MDKYVDALYLMEIIHAYLQVMMLIIIRIYFLSALPPSGPSVSLARPCARARRESSPGGQVDLR